MRDKKPDVFDESERAEIEKRRTAQLLDLRNVLSTDSGYRLVCRLLDECRLFDSIWSPSAEIHKNAGRQEFGQWLWREIAQASRGHLAKIVMEVTMNAPEEIPKQKKEGE